MQPKNLLFITCDQWRAECLSTLEHPTVKTPHLDALAADGVLFCCHYAQCTPCGPSRASIHTGMYLQNHRSVGNGTPLDARHTNLALEFRKLGYDPALAGYTDTTPDPRGYAPGDPALSSYEGILPGFSRVLGMSSENYPEAWAHWLEARGENLPANLSDLYYAADDSHPAAVGRGRTFRPPRYYTKESSETAFVTDLASRFIRRPGRQPWCLHLSYLGPHPPYIAPQPYNRLYPPDAVPPFRRAPSPEAEARQHPYLDFIIRQNLADPSYGQSVYPRSDPAMRQLRAIYYGLLSEVDDNLGQLIRLLKETGQYENTVIVFASDHGEQLGDHYLLGKPSYFDKDFHVPLIVRVPGKNMLAGYGSKVTAFTENVDILPTLMDVFDAPIPRQCDGRSLLPFLKATEPDDWRTEVHWEKDFRDVANGVPETALGIGMEECSFNVIRDHRFKYIHFSALPPLFFDLRNDPDELHNLATDPAFAPRMLTYAQKMISWRMQNDERILTHMAAGPGGMITRP